MAVTHAAGLAYLEAECARQSLADFARLVMPSTYEQPIQVLALIELLEALERRDINRGIVAMPPRSSKTSHVSRLLPSWWLGRRPRDGVILTSYGDQLSIDNGRAVRDLIEHHRYPFHTRLRADARAAGRWLAYQGGGLLAAGAGAGITGWALPGNLAVIDDLFKDRLEADSELIRDHRWTWFQEVLLTRIARDGAVLQTGTRWHEDDNIGRTLNSEGQGDWTVLEIPLIAGRHDPLGRAEGESLPVFGTVPSVEKGEISARAFSALYQQRPTAAEGGIFKRAWMQRRYDHLPVDEPGYKGRWLVIQTCDSAWKEGVGADWSVIATWGTDGVDYYLLDVWRDRVEYPDLRHALLHSSALHKPSRIYIESGSRSASSIALVQQLHRDSALPLVAMNPTGSKVLRAEVASGAFEAGKVVLPRRAHWLEIWIEEHANFPNAAHDDTCFVAGTLVATPSGDRCIESLHAGDHVLTPFGRSRVTAAGPTGIRAVESLHGVTGTPNHPLFAEGVGFITMADWTPDMHPSRLNLWTLLQWQPRLHGSSSTVAAIEGWAARDAITFVTRRRMPDGVACVGSTLMSGSTTAARRFRWAGRSITRTATRSITTTAIWSVYRLRNMLASLTTTTAARNTSRTSNGYAPLPWRGTGAARAASGTVRMLSKLLPGNRRSPCALARPRCGPRRRPLPSRLGDARVLRAAAGLHHPHRP